ncbi:hypothetical protein LX36DRAFT_663965 [Colletotrichum falcatum]|nr:hypothetical protein LX36DRAFT_663965 [Colletotrichum falcatum]
MCCGLLSFFFFFFFFFFFDLLVHRIYTTSVSRPASALSCLSSVRHSSMCRRSQTTTRVESTLHCTCMRQTTTLRTLPTVPSLARPASPLTLAG